MKYSEFCKVYEDLQATTKNLEKTTILSNFLEKIKMHPQYIYLLQGQILPDYDPTDLGISAQLLIRAIAKATTKTDKEIIEEFKKVGDLGDVAEQLRKNNKVQHSLFNQETLTTQKVIDTLKKIANLNGKGTIERKIDYTVDLLSCATPLEAKYIVRTILSDLRIGIGNATIRDAIVEYIYHPKDTEEKKKYTTLMQDAYDKSTDFAVVFQRAQEKTLEKIGLMIGRPVKVMLYPKAHDAEDAFRIVGKPAAFEYKYDGFRVMINKDEHGHVKIFTRRLEEVSRQFSEIVKYVKEHIGAKSCILDGEAVGFDSNTKEYTDFQAISQRIRRKHGIEIMQKKLPVELRLFDIIYYNGENLIEKTYEKRRELLKKITKEEQWKIALAEQIVTGSVEKANDFFQKALDDKQEGLMVKGLDKHYKPGARVGYGVKWKPTDKDFDVVIVGAEWGTGKRSGWLTSFDVACNDNGILKTIGKVSTGLKEKEEEGLSFKEMTKLLKPLETEEHGRTIRVQPKIVITVQYQNIQKSPTYESGYALRFPRVIRLRPDRSKSDIATLQEIQKEAG